MSFRNAGPIAAAVVFGIIGGSYTFGPLLKEQQKANDHWRNPGEATASDTFPKEKETTGQSARQAAPREQK